MIRVASLLVLLLCLACNHSHSQLRGSFAQSQDGKTYLAIMDDNGGHCGPINVDGRAWPYPIGRPGQIEPGHHTIACGGDVQIDIPQGVLFKFDYWGP